ncbi:2-oxoglutarate ferredoxin oxidoreductase subunit alpha, partial [Vibrio cholerae O1 biovar El Tor]|nr:2-oxoglutarate ferredoxin oxidoreductase subunit alpha [Vibrio cholerae O1 biovar El Tor]
GAEPWQVPDLSAIDPIDPGFATEHNHTADDGTEAFLPYKRDPETLARPWAIPGTPGLEHRIGGIEKAADTGNVSYDPANHEEMV